MADVSSSTVKLRVSGCWSGQIEASLDLWSVADLRSRLSASSGFSIDSFNIICAGKVLKDHTPGTLHQLGVKPNSKLLMSRVAERQHTSALLAEEERHAHLARIKAAVDAIVKRSGENSLSEDRFDIQLENQYGEELTITSEADKKALMLGLMLHSKARDLIIKERYMEALEVMFMAEEAFQLCDSTVLEAIDNVAFLHIDIVWCYFRLKDVAKLADAGKRLSQARSGLVESHGPQLERLRILQGGFRPELAVYLRLEVLEGIIAFHSGEFEASKKLLLSAQDKYNQLQVSDESLVVLTQMGFSKRESQWALRVSEQDVNRAIEFALEEKKKKLKKIEEDRRHAEQRRESRKYGRTASGKALELSKVEELTAMGYEKRLAAEALRQADNDLEEALNILVDPERNTALQSTLTTLRRKRRQRENNNEVDNEALQQLLAMGFEEHEATQALESTSDVNAALNQLLKGADELGQSSSDVVSDTPSASNEDQSHSTIDENSQRDVEMEEDIAMNLTGDPLAEYDIDVRLEGKAITEYLDMLASRIT